MRRREIDEENRLLERQWRQFQGELTPDEQEPQVNIDLAHAEPELQGRPTSDFHKDRWVNGVLDWGIYMEIQERGHPYGNNIPEEPDEYWIWLIKEVGGFSRQGTSLRSVRVSSEFPYYDFLAVLQVEIGRPLRYEYEDKKIWFQDKDGYESFKRTWEHGVPIRLAYVECEEEREERLEYMRFPGEENI